MNFNLNKELAKIKQDFKEKKLKQQIPNLLTASRLLAPFILIPLIYFNKFNLFIIMIILFSLTDAIDGYLARKYNSVSEFGKYLDCVVDKVFALSLLIPIIINFTLDLNFNLILTTIILELLICLLNIYAFLNKLDPKSTIFGKIKTYFLFILLCFLYLNKVIKISKNFLFIFILLTIFLQVITIISYIIQIKKRKILINSSLLN